MTELAPSVLLIEAIWYVAIVDQGDGLVVIEAPFSSSYSAKVLAEAQARFPSKPVKAVVTTSDSWPHLAGIREYAAHGFPSCSGAVRSSLLPMFHGEEVDRRVRLSEVINDLA